MKPGWEHRRSADPCCGVAITPRTAVEIEAVGTPEQELNFLRWLIEVAERHHENTAHRTSEAAWIECNP
jgi:hypothetical protein